MCGFDEFIRLLFLIFHNVQPYKITFLILPIVINPVKNIKSACSLLRLRLLSFSEVTPKGIITVTKDAYLEHLEEQIKVAKIAYESYLKFMQSSIADTPKTAPAYLPPKIKKSYGEIIDERKGLRGKGRTRDLFEYFYRKSATINEAAKDTGYNPKQIGQFYYRYNEEKFVEKSRDCDVISITEKGKALVDKSMPYTGINSDFSLKIVKSTG